MYCSSSSSEAVETVGVAPDVEVLLLLLLLLLARLVDVGGLLLVDDVVVLEWEDMLLLRC